MEHRIVVGVDGSPGSDAAVRWAAGRASAFEAGLVLVHCWASPHGHGGAALPQGELLALERDFAAVLEAAVARLAAESPDVAVERVLSQGDPAEVLTALGAGAELLVLGSRGVSGHTGLALGSVSRRCTERATCPVVIVPTP